MYPVGTILTYTGTWYASLFHSMNGVIADVSADLAASGLPVRKATPNVSTGAVLAGIAGLGGNTFNVTLQVQVENGLGYTDSDSVINQIRNSVNEITGRYPTGDSLPYSQQPSSSSPSPTGQPDTASSGVNSGACLAGSSSEASGNFSTGCWFKNLTTQGLSTVGLLSLVAIAGLGLLVWASGKAQRV